MYLSTNLGIIVEVMLKSKQKIVNVNKHLNEEYVMLSENNMKYL